MELNGVLNVYKEAGYTSHDVVAKLRGILHMKKIGHTGTLDPAATGVLPVCLGKGTKLCDLLTDHDKTYEAVMRLGVETDTQDMTGTVLAEKPVTVAEEELRHCMGGFVGEQQQIPPMYSALKVNGRKLYELAREGKVVERKPRTVNFYEITPLWVELPLVSFRVRCSKGTYIRTLCHDIGRQLGCGGAMEKLERTQVERFRKESARTLAQIEEAVETDEIGNLVIPADQMFDNLPRLQMSPEQDKLVHNGNPLRINDCIREINPGGVDETADDSKQVRVYDSQGQFIGLYGKKGDWYRPMKIFY